ncbi:uncharacterized protein PITG_02563 [Phytophthora infestans T30-4]|uniref:Uncharacterized protein n=1 Tax=Phytophthora infestans (strain T30-4) TaxID=403677 RepID=D0MWN0_PHYIT|nr:uncharacterized protein PITG_02563 [Phytophthora infestans T30-4]EEY64043.1 conserved hypothetical protein [Phytophthora infestans T30-4]|eukprot:XP_002907479.1 conserved hypothetical protein [Phytophthora infestans T30-4]
MIRFQRYYRQFARETIRASRSSKVLHFDFQTMVEGAGGYKYVLVITDGMSGFVELIAFAQAPLRQRLREVTRLVQALSPVSSQLRSILHPRSSGDATIESVDEETRKHIDNVGLAFKGMHRALVDTSDPTGRTSAPTSEDFDATRGDVEDLNEEADARGADAFEDAREEIRIVTKTQLAAKAPSMSDTSMESAPPSPKKPKIKDVRCSNFKGNEGYPGLGAGFENFIHEFEHAIRAEGLVNGSTWTNDLKASVIVNYLKGKASRYYHKKSSEWQRRHDGENMPYSEVKRAMRAEFGCKLSQLELSTKMRCNKRESDSWHDYLEYLNFIEGLMEGDQTKLVMEVFGNHACPELAATLLAAVPEDTTDYATESDRMKRLLYKLRGD